MLMPTNWVGRLLGKYFLYFANLHLVSGQMGYWLRGWFLKSYYLVSDPLVLMFTAYWLGYTGQVWVPINSPSIYWVSSMCQTLFGKQINTVPCARGASNPVCAFGKTGFSLTLRVVMSQHWRSVWNLWALKTCWEFLLSLLYLWISAFFTFSFS